MTTYEYASLTADATGANTFTVAGATFTGTPANALEAGNDLGAQGWELATTVAIAQDGTTGLVVSTFKRPTS